MLDSDSLMLVEVLISAVYFSHNCHELLIHLLTESSLAGAGRTLSSLHNSNLNALIYNSLMLYFSQHST